MDLVALQNWLDNASFAILFATMLIYWGSLTFPKIPYLTLAGTTGMGMANLGIAALLGARWLEAGYFPLSNLYESLFFIAWGITAMHFLAESMSRSPLVGAVTAPVAMAITAFAALTLPTPMQSAEPLVPALKSNWLMMHVSVMLLSYAALMVGSLLAVAFLVVTSGQNIELKGSSVGTGAYRSSRYQLHRAGEAAEEAVEAERLSVNNPGGTVALLKPVSATAVPQLSPQKLSLAEALDNISYRMIGLGFPLLTIGIIAGAVWANEAWGSYWSWDPKETWALITWLVFAAYLHARITRGWQGRRPAILAATGFTMVWICYLGVNLLGKGLHSYGWFL
ncbi:MAG: c-type cytochrome biogenesis protein CcsB [Pegethrix bostrychoides GSE-TBD4-15B]|jgi:cytochrome c-type biogenesis protein CcsB|uniref:Cytochrome c biogenesis protein CcsA n=1 Tax=Pegethrix bostrychoides GSE-TBD4-15B TaxID=2839662 RepID=A0A951U6Q2_9CYAN|nr:c-type cytochrome biogenesis protein CcsB [Pegethrix bostrychoides GSE-TBD4-15B]